MPAEFAVAEKCDPPKGLPDQRARMAEIRELNAHLGASDVLNNITNAVRYAEGAIISPGVRTAYYLIRYDHQTRRVDITPYSRATLAFASYVSAEAPDNVSETETADVVLFEADKIENLPRAYPNYFGDVQLFRNELALLATGKSVNEYKVALQGRAASRPREPAADPRWMGQRGIWFPPERKKR